MNIHHHHDTNQRIVDGQPMVVNHSMGKVWIHKPTQLNFINLHVNITWVQL